MPSSQRGREKQGVDIMRVIKKINNNAAICLDDSNRELVAIGTGVGFPECPYEITDLNVIQRTYYNVDSMYYGLLNSIPENIINVTVKIVDSFQATAEGPVSPNLMFTLADHIHFAIERFQKHIRIDTPLQYDIQHLYEKEYRLGLEALKTIRNDLKIRLPRGEASNIAMHFINAGAVSTGYGHGYVDSVIADVTEIVGEATGIFIDKSTFDYSRFVTHVQYLLKRVQNKKLVSSKNQKMFESIRNQYPDTYNCVLRIRDYFSEELDMELNEEELLYLILHVNRLCVREDCYQKGITPAHKD